VVVRRRRSPQRRRQRRHPRCGPLPGPGPRRGMGPQPQQQPDHVGHLQLDPGLELPVREPARSSKKGWPSRSRD
jgi:hypothetical protein